MQYTFSEFLSHLMDKPWWVITALIVQLIGITLIIIVCICRIISKIREMRKSHKVMLSESAEVETKAAPVADEGSDYDEELLLD